MKKSFEPVFDETLAVSDFKLLLFVVGAGGVGVVVVVFVVAINSPDHLLIERRRCSLLILTSSNL